jgi:hypothetical protein
VEVVMDMFVEEGEGGGLQYEEFVKCIKGYHNFLELWWRMRVEVLEETLRR